MQVAVEVADFQSSLVQISRISRTLDKRTERCLIALMQHIKTTKYISRIVIEYNWPNKLEFYLCSLAQTLS